MGLILKLVVDNINRLNPIDILIIFLFCTTFSFTAYRFIRWIFRDLIEAKSSQIKAQSELLQIKDGMISNYKAHLQVVSEQKEMIESKLVQFDAYSQSLEKELGKVYGDKGKIEDDLKNTRRNFFALDYMLFLLSFTSDLALLRGGLGGQSYIIHLGGAVLKLFKKRS
jgi:hypothetical protein